MRAFFQVAFIKPHLINFQCWQNNHNLSYWILILRQSLINLFFKQVRFMSLYEYLRISEAFLHRSKYYLFILIFSFLVYKFLLLILFLYTTLYIFLLLLYKYLFSFFQSEEFLEYNSSFLKGKFALWNNTIQYKIFSIDWAISTIRKSK